MSYLLLRTVKTHLVRGTVRSLGYAFTMKRPDEINDWYRVRLVEALDRFADGSADKFARFIGWPTGGGMVRQVRGTEKVTRPMQESILARCRQHDNQELAHWFDLPPELAEKYERNPVVPKGGEMFSDDVTRALAGANEITRWQADNAVRSVLGLDPLPKPKLQAAA